LGPIPPLGVTGAGVATVISFTASSVVLAWYVLSGRTAVTLSLRDLRLQRRLFREILRVGAPMSLQPIVNNVSLATLTGFVGMLGATALAGFGAAVRLEYTLIPLTFGLGASLQAMVGTNIGAGQLDRATRIAWTAAALAAGVTGAIGVLAMTWPEVWVAFFNAAPAVQLMAASYLCVVSLTYGFLGLGMTLSSAFQAAGRPFWPLCAITSRAIVVAVGGWLVIHTTDIGLLGIALVAGFGLIVFGATLALRFRAGAWRTGA
jgi:Na+-driven multidrug efflux pump